MILVCGLMADAVVELMCARLQDMGLDYFFLDERRYPGAFNVSWDVGPRGVTGWVSGPERRVDLEDVTGVYIRYVEYREAPEAESSAAEPPAASEPSAVSEPSAASEPSAEHQAQLVRAEFQASLMQLADILPCTVVNRGRASVSNDSKLWQGFVAHRFGLHTPRTLATTDPDAARAFYEACDRRVIFKSLSSVRSIVQRVDEEALRRLDLLPNCPTQFQECVDGVDVRVHTVGKRYFATQIVSGASDYRYAGRQGAEIEIEATELPDDIAAACIGVTKALGLVVAGIDLRRTPDGRYYFFEANPSPGFIFYERATRQPISEAIARLLHRGSPSPPVTRATGRRPRRQRRSQRAIQGTNIKPGGKRHG
jgi:glutathione synthase/RimK-type ligase-like ATP-grasp enzyme